MSKRKRKPTLTPLKAAQAVFREWCAAWKATVEVQAAADLVHRIEAAIVAAELRAASHAKAEGREP